VLNKQDTQQFNSLNKILLLSNLHFRHNKNENYEDDYDNYINLHTIAK